MVLQTSPSHTIEHGRNVKNSSLYGIGNVSDILTGLIIDYEILSKYCSECLTAKRDLGENSADFSIWYESHQSQNAAKIMRNLLMPWSLKLQKFYEKVPLKTVVRYVSLLSDGDAYTYQHLSSLNAYGYCIKILTEECINHVAKKFGTGIRNKISE
ncbi:uncharacterized protein TNCV_3716621 [Trichonephila clavipes]|nr:uncharacterized protein TNCV_3716621 [Trichonephila clavipes]